MKRICIILSLLLIAALLFACESRKAFEAPEAEQPVPVVTDRLTEAPTPEPTEAPTPEPTEAPTPEPDPDTQEGPVDAAPGLYCTMANGIEVMLPTDEPLWIPVFENITFLINGELMDSSQQLIPDEHILIADTVIVAKETCETEWTCVVRYNDTDYLTRTASVTLGEGENAVRIVIRADEPLAPGEYIVKLYEGDVFLGGNILTF